MVKEIGEFILFDGTAARAFPDRHVKLPRKTPGTGELDQLALEVTAVLQQICRFRRYCVARHGSFLGPGQPAAGAREHLGGNVSLGRCSRHP